MAAYDPRGCTGQGLGYATANSGATHLSGSTHAIEAGSYLSPQGSELDKIQRFAAHNLLKLSVGATAGSRNADVANLALFFPLPEGRHVDLPVP